MGLLEDANRRAAELDRQRQEQLDRTAAHELEKRQLVEEFVALLRSRGYAPVDIYTVGETKRSGYHGKDFGYSRVVSRYVRDGRGWLFEHQEEGGVFTFVVFEDGRTSSSGDLTTGPEYVQRWRSSGTKMRGLPRTSEDIIVATAGSSMIANDLRELLLGRAAAIVAGSGERFPGRA